jgi:hypothetical protein
VLYVSSFEEPLSFQNGVEAGDLDAKPAKPAGNEARSPEKVKGEAAFRHGR